MSRILKTRKEKTSSTPLRVICFFIILAFGSFVFFKMCELISGKLSILHFQKLDLISQSSDVDEKLNSNDQCISRAELNSFFRHKTSATKELEGFSVSSFPLFLELGDLLKMHNVKLHQDCKFLIYPNNTEGLGNKIMGLLSAFLYALLTNRVLLIDSESPLSKLLCEPFQFSHWVVPKNLTTIRGYSKKVSLQDLVDAIDDADKTNFNESNTVVCDPLHDVFHFDSVQQILADFNWLEVPSFVYYVPQLYLVPSFRPIMDQLFPDRLIATHLSRRILLPENTVWETIKELYKEHFESQKGPKVGVQVRYLVYEYLDDGLEHMYNHEDHFDLINERVGSCLFKESKLLPPPSSSKKLNVKKNNAALNTSITVLVASQFADVHYEYLKELYGDPLTAHVQFKMISSPHKQMSHDLQHNSMAMVEIFLLSFMDTLVTSANSTFGFVAQSLGDFQPWVLNFQQSGGRHKCYLRETREVCQLAVPPSVNVLDKNGHLQAVQVLLNTDDSDEDYGYSEKLFPYLRPCQDRSYSLVLITKKRNGR